MNWLLGIVGVVLLSVLAEVLLPQGQMSKYVQSIFAVLLLFVIVTPVVSLFRHKLTAADLINFDAASYETDEAYIDFIETEQRQSALAAVRSRYAAVVDVVVADRSPRVTVYVRGETPAGLGDYVCIVLGVEPEEVVIYESG